MRSCWTISPTLGIILLLSGFVPVLSLDYLEDNFLLVAKGIYRQQDMNNADDRDAFLKNGAIVQMSLNGATMYTIPAEIPGNPAAVAYDAVRRLVFWVDQEKATINSVKLDGREQKVVYKLPASSSPEGIAVDPMAQLIFYTDGSKDTINLLKYDGSNHKMLYQNALNPRTIHLDPIQYKLYWTDWGADTIERGNYDGDARTREVLIDSPGSDINGLSLDLIEHTMYWTDAKGEKVETATMDGKDRRTLFTVTSIDGLPGTTHLYGVAVDDHYIYVSDWSRDQIIRANKADGGGQTALPHDDIPTINEMVIYQSHRYQQGPTTDCNSRNDGCSNLCIPLPSGPRCDCPDDKRIDDDDMKTCLDGLHVNGPSFIWTEFNDHQTSFTRGVPGEPNDYLRTVNFHPWSVSHPGWEMTAVDFDFKNNVLYMVDVMDRYIVQMTLNGTFVISSVYFGISSQVHGLSYDWVAGNLYWADGLHNHIMMARVGGNTKHVRTVVSTGLDRPYSLAVYPQKGLLFWTDNGENDKIESSTLAGQDRKTLLDSSSTYLDHPTGIAVEYGSERVFWTNKHSLYSMKIDGTDIKNHLTYIYSTFVDVSVYQNFVFVSDQGSTERDATGEQVSRPRIWFYDLDEGLKGIHLTLDNPPSAAVMYSEERQPFVSSTCPRMQCDHICVTEADRSASCLCTDGFNLQADEKSCVEDPTVLVTPYFVYSIGEQICSIPIIDAISKDIARPHEYCALGLKKSKYEFHALGFYVDEGNIYFSETMNTVRSIQRADLKIKTNNAALMQGVGQVNGIAVDYMTSNVYWTDSEYQMIMVIRSDGAFPKLLISRLAYPMGIVVDTFTDKLYWAEKGFRDDPPRIGSANTDGTGMYSFYTGVKDDETPTGLTIDHLNKRLFYVDSKQNHVFSLSMDSDNSLKLKHTEAVIRKYPGLQIQDIALYEDYLAITGTYAQDNNNTVSALYITEKHSTKTNPDIKEIPHFGEDSKAFDVIAFSEENQVFGGPPTTCGFENGGCQQLCFQRNMVHSCGCVDGMTLNDDGVSCNPVRLLDDDFLLLADDYRHMIYQTDNKVRIIAGLNIPSSERPIALDYDPVDGVVYWSDFEKGYIRSMPLDGSREARTIRANVAGSRVDALAFEPVARLLYYTDMGLNLIGVLNPTGTYSKVLADDDVINPRALVLDTAKGRMYYTTRPPLILNAKIIQRDMDGLNPVDIVTGLGYPNGLALDQERQKLYWVDAYTETLGVTSLDGSDYTVDLLKPNPMISHGDPFSIALVGGVIYWTDWNQRGLFMTNRGAQNWSARHEDIFIGLNDVKYINKSALLVPNPCSDNNGGCSHFCIPTPSGRACRCPGNAEDPVDGVNCEGVPSCPNEIPNGQFESACSFRIGHKCSYNCNLGFGRKSSADLVCLPGGTWTEDPANRCTINSCGILTTGTNVKNVGDCPKYAAIGVSCQHACVDGYLQVDGNQRRVCQADESWSGRPLQCTPTNATRCLPLETPYNANVDPENCASQIQYPDTKCHHFCFGEQVKGVGSGDRVCQQKNFGYGWSGSPIRCKAAESKSSGSSENEMPLIAGIAISAILLVVIIIAGIIYFCRRRAYKKQGRYAEPERIPDGTSSIGAPSMAGLSVSPMYDVRNQTLNLNGTPAYDNPAYATTAQMHAMAAAPPIEKKVPIDDFRDKNSVRTAFSNPLSSENGMNDQLEKSSMR